MGASCSPSLALKMDGSLSGWVGQASPPAGGLFVTVVAAGHHSLAIRDVIKPVLILSEPKATSELFECNLSGPPGLRVDIEVSTGLRSWRTWTNLVLTVPSLAVKDSTGTLSRRQYYRATADEISSMPVRSSRRSTDRG